MAHREVNSSVRRVDGKFLTLSLTFVDPLLNTAEEKEISTRAVAFRKQVQRLRDFSHPE